MTVKLSEKQKKAVYFEGPSLLILAGPGTGKTRVLISRMEAHIDKGLTPEKILAVTFSRKATSEMEDRLFASRPELSGRVSIQTLHSLCLDLVDRFGFRLGLPKGSKLMTSAQANLLFRRIAGELPLDRFSKSSQIDGLISELLGLFQKAKDAGLWPEDFIAYAAEIPETDEASKSQKEDWQALGDVYNSFQNYCINESWIDFGDAILFATRLLSDFPDIREQVQSEFDAILVDEFQDTNWSQVQLIRNMASPQCQVTAVGDDDQSIYQFRGASYSAFQFFEEAFPNTEVVELTETYRLPRSVVLAAQKSISQNGDKRFRPNKSLESLKKESSPVKVVVATQYEQEAQWICDEIERLVSEGTKLSEIAVLVRSHSHGEMIGQEAKRRKIPVRSQATEALFEQDVIRDLMAVFRLIENQKDNVSLLRLLDSFIFEMSAQEIYSFCRWAKENSKAYLDDLDKVPRDLLKAETIEKLLTFSENLKLWAAQSFRESPTQILFDVLAKTGLAQKLMRADSQDLRHIANFMTQLKSWEQIQKDSSLHANFPLLESISRREIQLQEEEALDSGESEELRIMSVHASKGLEFDTVFIPSLVGRRFPGNFRPDSWQLPQALQREESVSKETHLLEERRLFYVGMTRAKRNLVLTAISKKGTKPSLFINSDLKDLLGNPEAFQLVELPTWNEHEFIKQIETPVFHRSSGLGLTQAPAKEGGLRLSFTQLESYEKCPRKYWFSYELGIPLPENNALLMGSLVHDCLEQFFAQHSKGMSVAEALEYYDKKFEKLQMSKPQLTERDARLGREGIEAYLTSEGPPFSEPLALEKSFHLKLGEHQISGKIDRVDKTETGVRIIDYKTGKGKEDGNESDQRFAKDSLQFSIYALAGKECFDWNVEDMAFHYVYSNSKLHTERNDQDLEKTKTKILNLASEIRAGKFQPTPGRACLYCEYKDICPDAK